jgi:hypothetical protein
MKLRIDNGAEEISYWLWCPGCDEAHRVNNSWSFNGDAQKPTFAPSILVSRPANPDAAEEFKEYRIAKMCHSFVEDGQWRYLADCTHSLANQTVPMVDLPSWLAAENH